MKVRKRRTTKLTNAFSNLWVNHECAMAELLVAYNSVISHGTIKTPAVAHNLMDHSWTVEEMVGELPKIG
jgi:hypothetical protein